MVENEEREGREESIEKMGDFIGLAVVSTVH